jgi:hypothetical protein
MGASPEYDYLFKLLARACGGCAGFCCGVPP